MIGETFTVNEKTYTIKQNFTLGDKRRINSIQTKFNELIEKNINKDELLDEQTRVASEQDELMAELLSKILGLSDDELSNLEYPGEVIQVFQEMISVSTIPKKKLPKQSDLPISQETPISHKY